MKVKNILPDQVKDLLTEDSLSTIETALQEKTSLLIETALINQDELYSQKLQQLMKAIDKGHTSLKPIDKLLLFFCFNSPATRT